MKPFKHSPEHRTRIKRILKARRKLRYMLEQKKTRMFHHLCLLKQNFFSMRPQCTPHTSKKFRY